MHTAVLPVAVLLLLMLVRRHYNLASQLTDMIKVGRHPGRRPGRRPGLLWSCELRGFKNLQASSTGENRPRKDLNSSIRRQLDDGS